MEKPQEEVKEVVHESAAAQEKLELSVEDVIERYVGSLGLIQVLHVLLASFAWVFDSQNTLITIFTDAQPSAWRCKPHPTNTSPTWCIDTSTSSGNVCGLAAGTWEWVGGNAGSIIAEWDLICDRKFLVAIPASLSFIGSMFGSVFYGRLGDGRLGRKKTLLLACILTAVTAFMTSLSPNIWIYTLLRFANGFARSGTGICCLVLSTEVVGRKWRGQVGQYGFFFFTFGFLSLPFIAYPTRAHWRDMYRILSLPPLVYTFLLVPLVSESPRWLLVRGKNKEALDVLQNFARLNGKKLPENIELIVPSQGTAGEKNENLWTTRWAAKRMILLMLSALGIGFVYYGMQLNTENLNFNLYLTVIINALMEIPAVFIGSLLLSFMNRRLLLSLSTISAGILCILSIIFSIRSRGKAKADNGWRQIIIEAVGFMAASIAFDVSYVYCVELFPTNVRNVAVSFLRQSLMLGASVSPLLVVVGRLSPTISFILFGALSIVSGIISLWLPETRGAPLFETLKQQEEEERLRRISPPTTV